MRVAPGLHVEWVENEAVILDPATDQLHHLSPTAALVYALIAEVGFEAAMLQVGERFPAESQLTEHLDLLVQDMLEKGLLVGD